MASSSHLATLLILSASLAILAPTCSADNYLLSGDVLYTGQSLKYGDYKLMMQSDCNLVLYENRSPLWASNTANKSVPPCTLHMQDDGNLVIYPPPIWSNKPVWASDSSRGRAGKYVLVLQPDRNVVIYGGSIWAAGSSVNGDGITAVTVSRNSTKAAADKIAMVTGK